jgi:hypothetical protein
LGGLTQDDCYGVPIRSVDEKGILFHVRDQDASWLKRGVTLPAVGIYPRQTERPCGPDPTAPSSSKVELQIGGNDNRDCPS